VLFVVDGNVLCLCFLSAQRMFPGRMFLLFMNEESIRWPMDVFLLLLIQFDVASVFGLPFAVYYHTPRRGKFAYFRGVVLVSTG
jgi:hypothetical protein